MNMLNDVKAYLDKKYIGRRVKVGERFGYIADAARADTVGAFINFDDGTERWYWYYEIELIDDENDDPLPLPG